MLSLKHPKLHPYHTKRVMHFMRIIPRVCPESHEVLPMFFDVYTKLMCDPNQPCITPLTVFPDFQDQLNILRQMNYIATEVTDISKVKSTVFKLLLDQALDTLNFLLQKMQEYNRLVEDIRDIAAGETLTSS